MEQCYQIQIKIEFISSINVIMIFILKLTFYHIKLKLLHFKLIYFLYYLNFKSSN